MNHYEIVYIPYVHVSVNTDSKFSLECMKNFIPTCLGSLIEIRSMLPLIKVYYCEKKPF